MNCEDAEEKAKWAQAAESDWECVLLKRASELRHGVYQLQRLVLSYYIVKVGF